MFWQRCLVMVHFLCSLVPHTMSRFPSGMRAALAAALVLQACSAQAPRPTTSPLPAADACLAVDHAEPAIRALADSVLLELGDREALYTLGGGLKPLSSDVRDLSVRIAPTVDTLALQRLERLREATALLRCGEIGAFVQVFTATQRLRDSSEVRQASVVLYHRAAVRRAVTRHAAFFATLGITPSADPRDVLAAVENAPRAPRWRGYGYLFGYPDDAVDFFVQAGEEGDRTGALVPRDFVRIPTVHRFTASDGSSLSTFVYAVPKGAPRSEADRRLFAAADSIYARYVPLRARITQPGAGQALQLWRGWWSADSSRE